MERDIMVPQFHIRRSSSALALSLVLPHYIDS